MLIVINSLSVSFSLCLINRQACLFLAGIQTKRETWGVDNDSNFPGHTNSKVHILFPHRLASSTMASWKMLRFNLFHTECGYVFESSTSSSAPAIQTLPSTSFSIQVNGVGVMNACRGQTMSPFRPQVSKWNSQQCTGQEVILVWNSNKLLSSQHLGR